MNFRCTVFVFSAVLLFMPLSPGIRAQITGGMLPPGIDPPGEPFSYFRHPNDVVGALYAPVAAEVTPEGYLYTGFGELMFFTGNPLEPVNKRIKTLQDGYLPIVQYEFERDGVVLANTIFDILAIDRVGDDYVPNVNKFQYHRFYGGSDTAHMLAALDYMGLHDIARRAFLHSLTASSVRRASLVSVPSARR
jgi:hypothetical protein